MKHGAMSAPKDDEQDRSSKEWQVDPPENSEQNCDRALSIARTDSATNQTGHFSPTVTTVVPSILKTWSLKARPGAKVGPCKA